MIPNPDALMTPRLVLTPLSREDLAEAHRIYGDPRTWIHLPEGRHKSVEDTSDHIDRSRLSWKGAGLGQWAARLAEGIPGTELTAGTLIGVGGCALTVRGAWNLGYRLAPEAWGHGFATELARAGTEQAHRVAPDRAVTARVLENNQASASVLEKIGLLRLWTGGSDGGDIFDLRRRVYADRPLPAVLLRDLIALG